jgi:valyl-tRNA synthetase
MEDKSHISIENKWRDYWQKEKIYAFDKNSKKKIYSIDTPPPTVSGEMHIGHAFSYSQQDFIARYKRMKGFNVFYPFGTDDNGLPTEKLIQKLKNVRSKDMSRAEFINLCLKTLKEITPAFIQDWINLGISCDYNILYSTIDDNSRKISQKYFIDLYKKGLIYIAEFPTIWDTEFQTPVAQAELEDKEKESFFTTLKFESEGKTIPIATTRPEMLPACLAIFVNPQDKRYKLLVGKKAKIPLINNEVPIIADEHADIEKGTGALMICSYGDKYDVEAVKKHKLSSKIIISPDGRMTVKPYENLTIHQAREKILEDLKNANLIIKQEKIKHVVNVYEKSSKEIEFLPTKQWFIKIIDKKPEWLKVDKKIEWLPEHMFKIYENWVNGLEWDWSISRDRHFGIPIPAWHCEKCKEIVLAKESELPIDPMQTSKNCPKCKSKTTPEKKVLDTWATSSLSPQIASSLVENKIKIPYSLRPQAHEIIRTWAFYTIVRAHYHENTIPWEKIAISGLVTMSGEKMSKSKGNIVKPQGVVDQYGSDALRFWAACSKLGENMDYQEKDIVTGKKFITKILNASNFVFMNIKDKPSKPKKLEKIDELFLRELNRITLTSTYRFEEYEYSRAKFNTEEFFWKDFCDYYLEIVKYRVYNGSKEQKDSALYTLYQSLLTVVKLMAPFTPFITEEIYQTHFRKYEKQKSIHLESWPEYSEKLHINWIEKETSPLTNRWFLIKDIISKVRTIKSENKKALNSPINLVLEKKHQIILKDIIDDLRAVTNAKEIKEGTFEVKVL